MGRKKKRVLARQKSKVALHTNKIPIARQNKDNVLTISLQDIERFENATSEAPVFESPDQIPGPMTPSRKKANVGICQDDVPFVSFEGGVPKVSLEAVDHFLNKVEQINKSLSTAKYDSVIAESEVSHRIKLCVKKNFSNVDPSSTLFGDVVEFFTTVVSSIVTGAQLYSYYELDKEKINPKTIGNKWTWDLEKLREEPPLQEGDLIIKGNLFDPLAIDYDLTIKQFLKYPKQESIILENTSKMEDLAIMGNSTDEL